MTVQEITLYSQPSCGPCVAIGSALKRKEIPYTPADISVDDQAREFIAGLGYTGTPVIHVRTETGSYHWQGMNTDRLNKLIKTVKEQAA